MDPSGRPDGHTPLGGDAVGGRPGASSGAAGAFPVAATAVLTALARAEESARTDRLFADPLAARVVARLEPAVARRMRAVLGTGGDVVAVRTAVIDRELTRLLAGGTGRFVVNLGAGFDARPLRLAALADLTVVEIDDPATLAHKADLLGDLSAPGPVVAVGLDLTRPGWAAALAREVPGLTGAVVVAEGLFAYLDATALHRLATELAGAGWCRHLVGDVIGTGSARNLAASADGLAVHGLDDLGPIERAGWRCTAYRPLPGEVRRLRPSSPGASHLVSADRSGLIDAVAVFEPAP